MNANTWTQTSWDEHVVAGPDDGPRVAHAHVTFGYTGVIEGNSTCEYLLYYSGPGFDGPERAPGLERVEGSVDGCAGSFVIRHDVAYSADGIADSWHVVEGSGTGELAGLRGTGTAAGADRTIPYTFDYTFG